MGVRGNKRNICGLRWCTRMGMGSMFIELCGWEVGVRLGWLPMTRRHSDWITWSLSEGECLL